MILDETVNAKNAWLKQVKHHRRRLKGLPRVGFNPNAGNVEHNISMMNMMLGSGDISNNPISGPFGSDVSASMGESLEEGLSYLPPSLATFLRDNIELIDTNNFQKLYSSVGLKFVTYDLTDVLLTAGIDPIPYLTDIPAHYASGLAIKELTIPSTVKTINYSAFYSCDQLESVVIEEGCEYIDDSAFRDCYNLSEVYLPKSLKELGESAFRDCSHLIEVIYSGTIADWKSINENWKCFYNTPLVEIRCSDGIYKL